MATIKITDRLGFDIDAQLADFSALKQYASQIPALLAGTADLKTIGGLTLDKPAVTSLKTGLAFSNPVALGGNQLTIQAGAHAAFAIASGSQLFAPDPYGDDIAVPPGECYASVQIDANVGAALAGAASSLQFGMASNLAIQIANYSRYNAAGTTLLTAIEKGVGEFLIPATAEELRKIPVNGVVVVTGSGSLKFSAAATIPISANPMAAVTLPAPAPPLKIAAGGSAQAAVSVTLSGEYQVRAQKLANGHVRLGWYGRKSAALSVKATVSESLNATFGDTDIFTSIVGAISKDPAADKQELKAAGLGDAQIQSIQAAVQAAVQRKLEVALSAEIGRSQSGQATFLVDIDLDATTPDSRDLLAKVLTGDLTKLHGEDLPGVELVRSIFTDIKTSSLTLKVNLLGIYNFISIAKLTTSGVTLFEPATGNLLITDRTTAERVRSHQINFGADSDKLRNVLAESFLITVAYHGSQQIIGEPVLECSHMFFALDDQTKADEMRKKLRAATALGLMTDAQATLPAGVKDFGRTTVYAETQYSQALAATLFLSAQGEEYDTFGRAAIQLLVREGDPDAARLIPAINDDLWKQMRGLGDAQHVKALFPTLPVTAQEAIYTDYLDIVWWSDAMAKASEGLAAMKKYLADHPAATQDDAGFQKLRSKLSDAMRDVASKTRENFGQPWGLVAMDQLANRKATATLLIGGPVITVVANRP